MSANLTVITDHDKRQQAATGLQERKAQTFWEERMTGIIKGFSRRQALSGLGAVAATRTRREPFHHPGPDAGDAALRAS